MENNIQIPPFYVGQEVVANRNHSQGLFKRCDEFKVTSITYVCCGWFVTVGIKGCYEIWICSECRYTTREGIETKFNSHCFSPKITIGEFISMREVAEKVFENVGKN